MGYTLFYYHSDFQLLYDFNLSPRRKPKTICLLQRYKIKLINTVFSHFFSFLPAFLQKHEKKRPLPHSLE